MKSKKSGACLNKKYNDIEFVKSILVSGDALQCMYAIRSCVINNFRRDDVIECLKLLKNSTLIEWNSCKIANCALAALHLMSIEPYKGNDEQVKELIDTIFFTTS